LRPFGKIRRDKSTTTRGPKKQKQKIIYEKIIYIHYDFFVFHKHIRTM
jgi:hypothetical protein